LKITAYGPGGQALGDFVPYEVQAGGRRAVYLAPECLYDVVRIGIEPGTAWGEASVEATVTVEGAIIADAVLANPSQGAWRADAEWSSGADFKTAAVGIFGFQQIYVVGVQRAYGKGETYLDYGEILRYWDNSTKTFFMPGDTLTGEVGTSWAATFWIYTQPFERPTPPPPPPIPPTPVPPQPTPTPTPGNDSDKVQPSPTVPTIPPIYMVKPGEVNIGLYVNGTFPFGTLPTILTVYLFTVDKGKVYFSVNYTISVEEGAVWRAAESGPIMNGTVDMPGNYSMIYNARIAHLIDKAVLLANRTGAPVIVGFYGWARRLDTNKTCSAYLGVPVLPGHVPVKPTASVTFYVYDAVTRQGISGANVTMVGPAYLTGLTNSTGYLTFENVRNGTYKVTVSASGYQTFSTIVTVARDMLLNMPLLPANAANLSALLVKVRTSDGVPVKGAAVYVNGTLAGYTDSYGEWGASYPWGARLNVTVSYMGWRKSQLVEMVYPRVLVVFEYSGRSEIFKPQVTAIFVQAVGDRVARYRNMSLLCAVMVNSNNTYTAEVGFKKEGRVVSKTTVTRSPSRSMLDIFTVSVNATETGALVPYLNVTWARADSDPRDNYVEGEPIRSVTRVFVALGITYEVEKWGLNVPGLIYPGSTVFRINVSIWVVGPPGLAGKVKMAKPMKMRAFLNHRLVSAYSQPLGNVTVWELGNGTALSVLATCPYARYMSPILVVDDLGSATEDYELVVNAPGSPKEVELPPHVIVQKTAEPLTPVVRYGDKVRVRVRVWTNLVKPGEGLNAKLYFHYGKLDNESYKFSAWSDVFNLQPGDQVVETQVPTPKEFKMQWYEAVKTDEGYFFLGATEDSWGGDNWAKATITYVNTGSVFTWILIGIGVIILLLVLIAFLRGGHSWRSAMAAAEASEWLEGGGEEGGGGWLEILKGFKPLFKL
ncbi:MAG: carboxypeptidase-like regulatory domain-containing protein, partial [Thermofilum sp.]|nr:carboxypeptidase-like regulatory domain-containing protein [Thermofilum sp.]